MTMGKLWFGNMDGITNDHRKMVYDRQSTAKLGCKKWIVIVCPVTITGVKVMMDVNNNKLLVV